ncbi:MAG: hypothetical protein H0V42_05455 [Nocardioidaceae bacterium]|nr:hypothetical protein [Nocardioidaceae bacterium]
MVVRVGCQVAELSTGIPKDPSLLLILREAEVRHGGEHLGEVGARIVAEVFLGIVREDRFSFLKTEPGWRSVLPTLGGADPSKWGMADLLAYAVPDDGRRVRIPDAQAAAWPG